MTPEEDIDKFRCPYCDAWVSYSLYSHMGNAHGIEMGLGRCPCGARVGRDDDLGQVLSLTMHDHWKHADADHAMLVLMILEAKR